MNDRQAHWEQIYRDKAIDEVSWYQANPEHSLTLIRRVTERVDAPIIDVGGGASLLVDSLLHQGYRRLAVLDISATALQHAQQRLGARGREIEWFVSDVTCFSPPHRFSVWHDRAVFHFLTGEEEREKYLEVLKTALQPGAQLIIATFAEDGPEKCSGLPVERYDATKMCHCLGDSFHLQSQESEVHRTPGGVAQHFNYFLFSYQP